MDDRDCDLPRELERQWREWASTEPAIDEQQLKRNLLERISEPKSRTRSRLILVAAAASLLAVFIGIESTRRPQPPISVDEAVVHETGSNVILVLREGAEPIYVATETTIDNAGGLR
jgi:hypothetical protein